jgi:hypothetical protein
MICGIHQLDHVCRLCGAWFLQLFLNHCSWPRGKHLDKLCQHYADRHEPLRLKWSLPALEKTIAQEDEGMAARTLVCVIQLQQALDKSPEADMKLMVGDEWVVSAHSSVLIARSRVFAGMLKNATVEKKTRVIKLEGVSVEGLLLFLEFLYLGTFLACWQFWYACVDSFYQPCA